MLFLSLIALIILFWVLNEAADVLVDNIKIVAGKLGAKIFLLGIVLGLFTSLPELAIAINATVNDIGEISAGNLLGGVVVVFCLVLGFSIIINRKIHTDGKITKISPFFIYLLLPFVLAIFFKKIGAVGGLILVVSYLALILHVYLKNRRALYDVPVKFSEAKVVKEILYVIGGSIIVLTASHFIVQITVFLLEQLQISAFVIGLLVYSLGTNLPELSVVINSWRKKAPDLSLSHLIGSAMANVLILGVASLLNPINFSINAAFYALTISLIIISLSVLFFYKTGRVLSRKEGLALIGMYLLFVAGQLFLNSGL